MYLIIYADDNEKQQISWKSIEKGTFQNYEYELFLYNKKNIVIVKSGIGTSLAAACTELFINKFKPTKVFNYGAVGGSEKLKQFDVVIPYKIYYHDVITPWYPVGQIPNQPKYFINKHPSHDDWNLATGMTFINTFKQLNNIKSKIPVDIFDMETAAIAQICNKNNIDFFVVKSISDVIAQTNDNLMNINECIKIAANKSFKKMINLIEKLT